MHKNILASALVIGLVLTMSSQVFGDPLNDQLNSAKSQYNQNQSSLSAAQKKASQLEADIQKIDDQIEKNMSQIDTLNGKIDTTQKNMVETQKNIQDSEDKIKSEKELYNQRIKAMYVDGAQGYINVLFDSKNLSDFLSKTEIIEKVTQADNVLINGLRQEEQDLQNKKDKLSEDKKNLTALQDDSNKKLADSNQKKAIEAPMIAESQGEVAQYTTATASQKAEIDAINNKISTAKTVAEAAAAKAAVVAANNVQASTSNNSSASDKHSSASVTPAQVHNPTPPVVHGGDIISFVESFIGVPYVWGGESPSGFDCSGLTQYAYAHIGVNIPRTSEEQFNIGTSVSVSNLQPGDLLFFEKESDGPAHVGMYVGNGLMIQAPHTGANVYVSALSNMMSTFCGARRVN
ncbi:C40 family peptidase [Clostridium akagii]|uniref:C40 family peptidase n=1 Tax=Clostridium akagii TaxID=91623 RepID=UPI00047ABE12|nr:C40 family peptidase [Clostridium akagii]